MPTGRDLTLQHLDTGAGLHQLRLRDTRAVPAIDGLLRQPQLHRHIPDGTPLEKKLQSLIAHIGRMRTTHRTSHGKRNKPHRTQDSGGGAPLPGLRAAVGVRSPERFERQASAHVAVHRHMRRRNRPADPNRSPGRPRHLTVQHGLDPPREHVRLPGHLRHRHPRVFNASTWSSMTASSRRAALPSVNALGVATTN